MHPRNPAKSINIDGSRPGDGHDDGHVMVFPPIWVVSLNGGFSPKMDGENHGKTLIEMDDLGGKTTI